MAGPCGDRLCVVGSQQLALEDPWAIGQRVLGGQFTVLDREAQRACLTPTTRAASVKLSHPAVARCSSE